MVDMLAIGSASQRLATLLTLPSGVDTPPSFAEAQAIVARASATLPPAYLRRVGEPLAQHLYSLGSARYAQRLQSGSATSLTLLLGALRLRASSPGHADLATASAQELISDIYDGFLSASDRRGFSKPDFEVIPPLIAWERSPRGPAFVAHDRPSGVELGVVAMPASLAVEGLWAWPLIAHEVGGHEVLLSGRGLLPEITERLRARLFAADLGDLVPYWSSRVHEASADILGVLNVGPVLALSLWAYLGARHGIEGGPLQLRTVDTGARHYPLDVLRAWAVADTVGSLRFSEAGAWRGALQQSVWSLCRNGVWFDGRWHEPRRALASAQLLAQVVAHAPLRSLGERSFSEIQNWTDADHALSLRLAGWLRSGVPTLPRIDEGCYAAHGIAASLLADLRAPPFDNAVRTLWLLAAMHRTNPVWQGSPVLHPGDVNMRSPQHSRRVVVGPS